MTNNDWQEIRELRKEFMGTSKGIALGNLIAEQQRLKQIKQIVKIWTECGDYADAWAYNKIRKVLE